MLRDEQILGFIPTVKVYKDKPPIRMVWLQQRHVLQVGRAVEAEVRKQDTTLIRQLVEALTTLRATGAHEGFAHDIATTAITAGRARLEGKP